MITILKHPQLDLTSERISDAQSLHAQTSNHASFVLETWLSLLEYCSGNAISLTFQYSDFQVEQVVRVNIL